MRESNANTIYKRSGGNVFKTWFFLIIFSLVLGLIGYILATVFNNVLFLYVGSAVSIGISLYSYWFSDKLVLRMANAKPLAEGENEMLQKMVERLSGQSGIPTPKIYIINDPAPNAFATGRNPENSAVAFTTGILTLLNERELEGVTAHELTHIINRDTLLMTVVSIIANIIQTVANFMYFFGGGQNENRNPILAIVTTLAIIILAPLAATIVQLAISRRREFQADAGAAEITRFPSGLADALRKINQFPFGLQEVNPSIAHLFIADPEKEDPTHKVPWYAKLFMSHPPVEERIKALLG